jgi:WD40 repeat protein
MYRARETSVEARILQGRDPEWTPLIRTVPLPRWGGAVKYSHDGRMFAVGGGDFSQLFLSGTGERLAELESSCDNVWSISFSCDNRTLATASGSTVRLWDVASGSLITTLVGDSADFICADFHPYIGYLLVAGDEDGRVYIWDVRDSSRSDFNVVGSTGRLCWVQQREQKRIIVRCREGKMKLWDINSLRQVQVFSSSPCYSDIFAVASSDDGSLVASDAKDGILAVYRTHTGKVVYSRRYGGMIYSVAFSPTAPILAFGSEFGAGLWLYTTDRILSFPSLSLSVFSVAFSPNGRFIASASNGPSLHIWETDAADQVPDDSHHSYEIRSVHFSNDGQLIVSASVDGTVRIWNAVTGALCTTLKGHTREVWDAIFLPDNVHVVSIDEGGVLKVWDWQKQATLFADTAIARDHGYCYYLFPYTDTSSPLGFISTHKSLDRETYTVRCWTIALSGPRNTRIVPVAHGAVKTSGWDIPRITHRGSAETSNPTLVLECDSGKQFSALWDGPTALCRTPAQLRFVEDQEESPLKHTCQRFAGSEVPCHLSDDKAWVMDEHDRQILWVPPANRGYWARWHGHRLVIGSRDGPLTLADFSGVILNDDIEF